MKITLHYLKNVEQNASEYYEKAKKAKKKMEGLVDAIALSKARIKTIEQEKDKAAQQVEQQRQAIKVKVKKEWYEKFRWFYTSKGNLVIGGRDAQTNEMIIKKYTQKGDRVFHTDMAGSPFFVIKFEGKEFTDDEMKEVAEATAAYSRAWGKGLASTDVFWVTPEQVTKEAKSGEYLGTGAFVIRGKTTYVPVERMAIALAFEDGRVIGGPVAALHGKKHVIIVQGDKKPGEIAKTIRYKLGGGDLDDIIRFLPSGGLELAKQ